jgi:hypothetical protein
MKTDTIKDFKRFVNREIVPAIADLKKLREAQRIHVQKLVYTNLVDRFDVLVDTTILANCREEVFFEEASKELLEPVTGADLVRLLMHSDTLQDALDSKLKGALRNSVLRQRHSKKLEALFRGFTPEIKVATQPRVNPATGKILDKIKWRKDQPPLSVCGYADWLYSRRNAVVHGGGKSSLLGRDKEQLERLYKFQAPTTFKIKLSSIQTAASFYLDVADILVR